MKFLLIDHSIAGVGGHYLEYAGNVLKAAKACGMDIYLAANKSFGKKKDTGIDGLKIYPCFKYDVWGKKVKFKPKNHFNLSELKRKCKYYEGRICCRVRYSPLNYARKGAGTGDLFLNGELANPLSTILKIILLGMPCVVLYAFYKMIEHIILFMKRLFDFIINKILWFIGFNTHQTEKLKERIKHPISEIGKITYALGVKKQITSFKNRLFVLTKKTKLQKGDIIFIPTLSENDLKAVLAVLAAGKDNGCSWHLVMRRSVFEGREPEYPEQIWGGNSLRNTLQAFTKYENVFFYTDTDELTKQYDLLSEINFYTLPIPINELFYEPNKTVFRAKCNIVYAGDARSEKGYQYIPDIAEELFEYYKCESEICFDLQSNFTFENDSDDIDVVLARKRLRQYNHDSVNLRLSAMEAEEYVDFIRKADMGLLLYDRNNYYARSSGALVEFLASGIPVIVFSGSWLSAQIEDEIESYQWKLRERADIISGYYMDSKEMELGKTEDNRTFMIGPKEKRISTSLFIEDDNIDGVFLEYNMSEFTKDGVYVRTIIEQYNEYDRLVQKKGYDYKKGMQEKHICFYRINSETKRIKLILYCPFGEVNAVCNGLSLYFSQGMKTKPYGVVGICCTQIDETAEAVMEILSHLKHYRDSASRYSAAWNKKHSVSQLMNLLIKNESERYA